MYIQIYVSDELVTGQDKIDDVYIQVMDSTLQSPVGEDIIGGDIFGTQVWDNLISGHSYSVNFHTNNNVRFDQYVASPSIYSANNYTRLYWNFPTVTVSKSGNEIAFKSLTVNQ